MGKFKTYLGVGMMCIGMTLPMCSCQRVMQKVGSLTAKVSDSDTAQTEENEDSEVYEGPITMNFRPYDGKSYFQAEITRPLFAEQEWLVQWPESAENCNLKKFQKELLKFFGVDGADDIEAYLTQLQNNFGGDGDWKKVNEMGNTDTSFTEIDDYNPYPQSVNIACEKVSLTDEGIVTYKKAEEWDSGTGLGAGFSMSVNYMMYDLKAGKRLRYDDFFTLGSAPKIAKLLKTKAINLDEYRTIIDGDFNPVHTNNFYVDLENKAAHFVYDKYEIAAGVDGVVELIIPLSAIQPYLK